MADAVHYQLLTETVSHRMYLSMSTAGRTRGYSGWRPCRIILVIFPSSADRSSTPDTNVACTGPESFTKRRACTVVGRMGAWEYYARCVTIALHG